MAVIVKKPIQVSFRDLCGNVNFAPVIKSGFGPIRVKEIADNAVGENTVIHTGSSVLKFTDSNASDFHTAKFVPLGGGYLGAFSLAVNQAANTVKWTFKVSDAKIDHLQEGETLTQKYRVTINDGHGGKATKDVSVVIVGTNDVPVIQCPDNHNNDVARLTLANQIDPSCDVSGTVTEDNVVPPSTTLSDTGSFKFDDVDLKDTHTITVLPSGNLGILTATLTDTATGIGDGTITWTYKVDNDLVQYLDDGETKVETFNIKIDDGHGGVVVQPITVTIKGINDAPVIVVNSGNSNGANDQVLEAALAIGSNPSSVAELAGGTFKLSDPHGLDDLQSVTINGTTHSIAELILGTSTFPSLLGVLTVTAYDPLTGIATYTYELTSPSTDVENTPETDVFTLTVFVGSCRLSSAGRTKKPILSLRSAATFAAAAMSILPCTAS